MRDNARRTRRMLMALIVGLVIGASPGASLANEHDSSRSGHPLRVVAYLLHPVGYLADLLIMRPAHWVVNQDGIRSLFGHTENE